MSSLFDDFTGRSPRKRRVTSRPYGRCLPFPSDSVVEPIKTQRTLVPHSVYVQEGEDCDI